MPYSPDSLEGRASLVRRAYETRALLGFVDEVFSDYAIVIRDGKYFRLPYTVDGEEVSFGEPDEVRIEYRAASEALEALTPKGKKWEVRLIREGVSKRGWIYTRKALETMVPFVSGAPLKAMEALPGVYAHRGPAKQIGRLSNPQAREADGFYEPLAEAEIDDQHRDWLLGEMKAGRVGGVSINAPVEAVTLPNGQVWVKKFLGLESLDLATTPAAGGAFLRATEGVAKGETMKIEDILAMLKKCKREDLIAKLGDSPTIEQAQEALEEALSAPDKETGRQGDKDKEQQRVIIAQEAQEMRDLLAQGKIDSSEAYLARKLSESNLPEAVKGKIKKKYSGKVFAREALDEELTWEKEMMDDLQKSGQIKAPDQGKVEVSQEAVDKIQIALDRTFGVKVEGHDDIKPWRGLKEAYVQITGDGELVGRLPGYKMKAHEAIVAADFPKLLDRTMNRRVVQDYREVDYGERRIISFVGSAADFKTQEANRVGYFNDLSTVDPETQDYQEATKPGEESITYKVTTRGNILTITRVTIMNDDLSGITRRVRTWGRAARRTFARFVWKFWIDNSTYDGDSTAWFTVGHGNLQTVALSAAEIVAAITKLMNMTEPGSGEKLGNALAMNLLLAVPVALWDAAVKINQAQYLDAAFTPNAVYHKFGMNNERILVNPILTDTNDWGVFADPAERDILEVKFLNGQEEPETFLADQPTVGQMFVADKLQYKIRHEYGGDILDFRGAVKAQVA